MTELDVDWLFKHATLLYQFRGDACFYPGLPGWYFYDLRRWNGTMPRWVE